MQHLVNTLLKKELILTALIKGNQQLTLTVDDQRNKVRTMNWRITEVPGSLIQEREVGLSITG